MRASGLLSAALVRVLLALGFAVAGWLAAALLASAAHAAEGSGVSGLSGFPAEPVAPGPPSAEEITTEVQRELHEELAAKSSEQAAVTPARAQVPVAREPQPAEPAAAADPAEPAEPVVTDAQASAPAPSRGLLGSVTGTVGTLVGTVTDTVTTAASDTVSGVIATVGAVGLTGDRTTPILGLPTPELRLPPSLLPGLPVWQQPEPGDQAGIAVPGELPGAGQPDPAAPHADAPHRQAPQPQPAPAPAATGPATAAEPTRTGSSPEPAGRTEVREIVAGGSSMPGGVPAPLPAAPVGAVVAAQVTVAAQHDHAGGRSVHGILSWEPTQAQLRLAGTSREHDADGAGRQAALPTTTPD